MRVLLVEDSLVQALVLRRYIEAIPGWQVTHQASLAGAKVAVAEEGPRAFGVVVVDLTLPDAHDLEAVQFAAEALPDAVCVVVSGVDQVSTATEALRSGASDFLVKSPRNLEDPDAIRRMMHLAVTRRELELQHREAEANLRGVLGSLRDAIFVVDPDGDVLFSNPVAEALDVGFHRRAFAASLVLADPAVVEQRTVYSHARQEVPVEVRTSPVRWAGAAARLVVLRDLTAERRAQVAENGVREGAALAAAGLEGQKDWHDVGNKLKSVARMLDNLSNPFTFFAEDEPAPAEIVRHEVSDMLAIVSKYEVARKAHRVLRTPVDVGALIQQRCFAFRANTAMESLRQQVSPTPMVLGDPVELGQVIDNLLWNALKAIRRAPRPDQHGTIVVAGYVEGDRVVVCVSDDGPGFVGKADQFWTPGVSGDASGSGLGLARLRETVHAHGGACGVRNVPGEGASVWFNLPILQQGPAVRRKVLMLEDDASAGVPARRLLSAHHEVTLVEDGIEGIHHLLEGHEPDVILCDLYMPGMDGIAFYQEVAGRWPKLLDRMVFCTGGVMTQEAATFLASVPTLDKPVSREAALAMIESIASRRS